MTQPIALTVRYQALWLLPCSLRTLKKVLASIFACVRSFEEGRHLQGIELHLLSDRDIALANSTYLGCTGPTNILSFPGGSESPGTLLLSLDTYARECLLYAQPQSYHLVHLLAHGSAHLTGLDHGERHATLEAAALAKRMAG